MIDAATIQRRMIRALAAAVFLVGCGSFDEDGKRVHFWEFEQDTDSDTGTDEPPAADECPQHYLDMDGRCIRYVDFQSENPVCGFTWNTAFTDIQSGIESAFAAALIVGHCDVWVAAGLYRSYDWSATNSIKLRPGVSVYGGFAGHEKHLTLRDIESNPTIIDGREEDGPGRSYHVVVGSSDAALDGVIVQGGDAGGDPPHHRGGGLYLNAAATKVRNCVFRENRAVDGGAVFSYALQPSFVNTIFEDNEAERGGAIYSINGLPLFSTVEFLGNRAAESGGAIHFERSYDGCHPKLTNVLIEGNTSGGDGGALYNLGCLIKGDGVEFLGNTAAADGGAVATFGGSLTLESSVVRGNEAARDGGGILARHSNIELNRGVVEGNRAAQDAGGVFLIATAGKVFSSRITGNRASRDGGGLAVLYDSPRVVNTTITGNRATNGGGMHNGTRAEPVIINSLLHGNRAEFRGGGMYNADLAAPRATNTILWNDYPDEIHDEDSGTATLSFCLVQGWYPGHNVIELDPLFRLDGRWHDGGTPGEWEDDLWVEGEYYLSPGSPCINFSDEAPAPINDANGDPWVDVPDVGLPGVAVDMGPLAYSP